MNAPRVYIETYGCSFNAADGEALAGVLLADGFRLAARPEEADVVVLNTCTVKDRTYLNFEKRFGQFRSAAREGKGPALVVAGCIPRAYANSELLAGVATLGPDTIDRAGEVARAALAGLPIQRLRAAPENGAPARSALPARRRQANVLILPISSGCLSACAFCQTRLARGRLRSFRPGDLVRQARDAVAEGAMEVWVTSQDTGAYGRDAGWSLAWLLEQLCAIDGEFRVRLGMSSPIWIHEDLEPLLAALAHPKMFQFLHVPVQSGSDAVLAAMRRGNTAAQFERVAERFGERFPEGLLMTDVIVGYPTESEGDFEATLAILERTRPAAVNRSKFSPRPGTAAAGLRPLPSAVIRERSRRLEAVARRLAREANARLIGRRERVLTGEIKANGTTLAHNVAYRPVVLAGEHAPGRWLTAHYQGAADYHLKGVAIGEGERPELGGAARELDFRLLSAPRRL